MTLKEIEEMKTEKQRQLQSILAGPGDYEGLRRRSYVHAEYAALELSYRDALDYWRAAESWDQHNFLYGFDESKTTAILGPKPIRPNSWKPTDFNYHSEQDLFSRGPSGAPLIDEYPYRSRPEKPSGRIVFGPVVPRYDRKARLIGLGSSVSTVPVGTRAVCPEDGIEYMLQDVGGIFGSTLLWIAL